MRAGFWCKCTSSLGNWYAAEEVSFALFESAVGKRTASLVCVISAPEFVAVVLGRGGDGRGIAARLVDDIVWIAIELHGGAKRSVGIGGADRGSTHHDGV